MKNWLVPLAAAIGVIGFRAATDVHRDDTGAIVDAGNLNAFEVQIGDCFDDTNGLANEGDDSIDDLPGVPCANPHDNEVFAVFDLEVEEMPDEDTMSQLAFDSCVARFEDFVGLDYPSSRLDVMTLYPTADSWRQFNDREVVCAVYDMEANKLVGTVKGEKI